MGASAGPGTISTVAGEAMGAPVEADVSAHEGDPEPVADEKKDDVKEKGKDEKHYKRRWDDKDDDRWGEWDSRGRQTRRQW